MSWEADFYADKDIEREERLPPGHRWCERCEATGLVWVRIGQERECPECHGDGYVPKD